MIIRSRADETQIWYGTMGSIDRENPTSNQSDSYYYGMVDTSESTTSSSYPFYVDLESSDGLMLGQHVYIERDEGQESQKDGLWLSEYYIVDADKENPYVWAANEKNRLEKRYVILGNYDEDLCEYEIVDGLTKTDLIAFPEEDLTEGRMTTQDSSVLLDSTYDTFDDYEYDDYEYDDYEYDDYEYDDYEGDYEEMPEIIEESYDEGYDESYEESYDESYDEMTDDFDDEELVPLEGAPVFGSDDVEAAG
jgi:HlyD family secretion protein